MNRVLVYACFFIITSPRIHGSFYEGDACEVGKLKGVCKIIVDCKPALLHLKEGELPVTCSFDGNTPIVCCIEDAPAVSVAQRQWLTPDDESTTAPPTAAPTTQTTTEATPGTTAAAKGTAQKFGMDSDTAAECPPVDANMTLPKSGRKAFDKCIEYQERLVFPCDAASGRRYNSCWNDINTYIIGGQQAFEGEFPHMALIGYGPESDLQFLCGGSLISEQFVLTASHCSAARGLGNISYVLLGTLRLSSYDRANLHRVRTIYKHPDFKPPGKYHDLALLKLENPVKLDEMKVPACLDVELGSGEDREMATATGFGTTSVDSKSDDLLKVELARFPSSECSARYLPSRHLRIGFDAKTQLCYGHRKVARDTCQGDSGGPLQIRHSRIHCMYTLIGVTSFGRGCGVVGEPAVYTRVANYVDWIESIVWP